MICIHVCVGDKFTSYDVVNHDPNGPSPTVNTIKANYALGRLHLDLKSSNGCSLNCKVKLFTQKKDHPSSIQRVGVLKKENEAMRAQKVNSEHFANLCDSATTEAQFRDVIDRDNETLKTEVKRIISKLYRPIKMIYDTADTADELAAKAKVTHWHIIWRLSCLFNILTEKTLLHSALSKHFTNVGI
jgi:hypothetical protein